MRRYSIAAVAALLVGMLVVPGSAFGAAPPKVDLCHLNQGTGGLIPIGVSRQAADNHLANHAEDVLVGDGVDGACNPLPVLAMVQARGELLCGVSPNAVGFSVETAPGSGVFEGLEADMCRVVAAAVLGDADAVEFVPLDGPERSQALEDGTVDVLMSRTTNHLGRDASAANGGWGANFGPTYFYDGQGILVDPTGPGLAGLTAASTISDIPDGTTVCTFPDFIPPGERFLAAAAAAGKSFNIIFTFDRFGDYSSGVCDVVSADDRSALAGRLGVILSSTISKEPLAPAVADGDDEWMAVVDWSIDAVIFADEVGITSGNIDDPGLRNFPDPISLVFGPLAADTGALLGLDAEWAYRAIKQVGNYGEIYAAHLEPVGLGRAGTLNESYIDGGLLYAPPIRRP